MGGFEPPHRLFAERDWDYPRLRLRAHHQFPALSGCERFAVLSAVVALLRGTVIPGARGMDPLARFCQVLTPEGREGLAKLGRRWLNGSPAPSSTSWPRALLRFKYITRELCAISRQPGTLYGVTTCRHTARSGLPNCLQPRSAV
jgi:hypothetical protein